MPEEDDEISSVVSWDDHIDNWTEFCKELKGELPRFQTLRRRQLAAAKLRMLMAKLDDELDRAIVQLGEQDMQRYIAGGGEDAWTGFLSTARRLGKKASKQDGEAGKLTNATARVQHMERSKEMVSIFNRIVRSHDEQLKGAVLTLTRQQMDKIVQKNHEKFSGTHKQRDQAKGSETRGPSAPKTLDHAFVTPRVKSAAKSREAVSLLNKIVSEKDSLLKKAIETMERKERTLLTSKNNDFLKFEAQRAKQREEFRQAKRARAVADHPHATMRVRQTVRVTTTLEKLKESVKKRSKALATSVKRIPKTQRDSFVRKVNGVTKDKMTCTENALSLPAPDKQKKKNLDTKRYARAEVMGLSRRVKADVQRAIEVKDKELEKVMATMDEEELRVLGDATRRSNGEVSLEALQQVVKHGKPARGTSYPHCAFRSNTTMASEAYGGGAAAAPEGSAPTKDSRDSLYSFDEQKLELLRNTKPWTQDPKYFKKVKISPSAAMKMLMHANSGVEKGMSAGGKPVEIMGMMLGRPDTETPNALIVTDVFPLPVEGAETKVLADDQEVSNYMINLGDLLETTRKERFMGWYHSHPFDVEVHSHCFLSSVDISTQLSWQRAEDPHGNPWLAIVVDPLRSLAKSRPEFGAFRVYPPEFSAPLNETPDGKIVTDDTQRVELWGSCWNRYYSLEIEYFMSSLASDVMGILTENFLWMRTLGSTPILESENRERFAERICNVAEKVEHCDLHMNHGAGASVSGYLVADSATSKPKEESAVSKTTHGSSELAIEHCQGQMTQITKSIVFGVRPVVLAASSSVGRGSRWIVSTKGGGGEQPPVKGKMPRLTHRMRRLARAHPEAVAAVSPSAVQYSRSKLTAEGQTTSQKKSWSNADLGTPEFFEWLNTIPPDAAERLARLEAEEDELGEYGDDDEDRMGDGPLNVGKAFLIPRARNSPYDQDIFAPSLLEARDMVLEARSPAQLRKAHDRLRATETALALKAGDYSTVKVGFEEPAPSAGSAGGSLEGRAQTPQMAPARGSNRSRGGANRVVYGPSETFAYVYHRMMPAYTVLHRVMAELKSELSDLNPRSMLDFGSGPGTAALAVWDVWGMEGGNVVDEDGEEQWEEGSRLSEVRMVEESQSMKDACKIMLEPLTKTGRIRTGFGSSLLEEARAAGRGGSGGAPGGKKFDLVVAAYSLSHLPTHASRAAATAVMWSLVAPGGALVLVEDGSAKGSHTVRSARQMVLRPSAPSTEQEEDKSVRGGRRGRRVEKATPRPYVVGPCRHDMECPLQAGELCRFQQKVPWNAVNVTRSAVRSVPFSYVSIRKGPPMHEEPRTEELEGRTSSSSVDLLKAFVQQRNMNKTGAGLSDAMDALGTDGISDATLKRGDWARLIRKPLKAKGHALLDVCSPEGNIQRKVVAKGKWKGAPGVFVAARKSQLGGLWPYLDNHDVKDRTAELRAAGEDRGDDNFEGDGGDGDSEDGGGCENGWGGDEGWEPVVDLGEEGEGVGGARGSRRRGGRGRRKAPLARRGRRSREEREVEAMSGGNFR
eukprot:g9414.t3